MRRPPLGQTLLIATLFCACSSSKTRDEDAGITFDATPADTGSGSDAGPADAGPADAGGDTDAGELFDSSVPDAVCGDGTVGAGEQCDDGNTDDGDGCDGDCAWEGYCGDGTVDDGETCDDGNNRSGDGCRADCGSDESCGNGIVDTAVGEVCDSTSDCAADCMSVTGCGDTTVTSPETCDDGNTDSFDGCGPMCREEVSLVLDSLEIGGPGVGCDFSGDGEPDNALAAALGSSLGSVSDMLPAPGTELIILLHMLGLDDPTGADDPSLRVAWLIGEDADTDPSNNVDGTGTFLVDPESLDADGRPEASFESSIASRMLSGGPEDVAIPAGLPIPLEVRRGYISGTTTEMTSRWHTIEDGLLCGAMPMGTVATLPNLLTMLPFGPPPPCDGSDDPGTMADVLVGGVSVFGYRVGGVQPDVDLDGDGLESYEVDSGSGCQGVITACIDGDGTRVEGRGCATDPRFEDGYSTALPFTAIRAGITGVAAP